MCIEKYKIRFLYLFYSAYLSAHNNTARLRQNIRSKGRQYSNWRLDFALDTRRLQFLSSSLELHYAVRIIFASARSTIIYVADGPLENLRVTDAAF